jgi:hypothetical protein
MVTPLKRIIANNLMPTFRLLLRETTHTVRIEEPFHLLSRKEVRRSAQSKTLCFLHNVFQSSMSRSDLRTNPFFFGNARGWGNLQDSSEGVGY